MARIVDSACVRVPRAHLAAIHCAIREIDPRESEADDVAPQRDWMPLDVDEVFSDTLHTGGLWDMDRAGYNFRHNIKASAGGLFPRHGARYEVCYLFDLKSGDPTIVRFYIRVISHD
jgi:hypothetical protein